jgi:hypothetical protein
MKLTSFDKQSELKVTSVYPSGCWSKCIHPWRHLTFSSFYSSPKSMAWFSQLCHHHSEPVVHYFQYTPCKLGVHVNADVDKIEKEEEKQYAGDFIMFSAHVMLSPMWSECQYTSVRYAFIV